MGAYISMIASEIDFDAFEKVNNILTDYCNDDVAIVSSAIEDKRMTEGKIVLIFTGIH